MEVNNIDWNKLWMDAQQKNIDSGHGGECWTMWQEKDAAKNYFSSFIASPSVKKRVAALARMTGRDSRVLDIGAGPGNIAIPLSRKVAHISAVEPAAGMAEVFGDQIRIENAHNIRLVQKRWEDVDVERDLEAPYDLTFASFSLGMLDLRASIEKMLCVSTNVIVLYWHVGLQAFDEDAIELSPLLYSKKHFPVPDSNVIFNLLYSMQIYPDVEIERTNVRLVYKSFDEVLEDYARRYGAETDEQRRLLAGYLHTRFIPFEKGSVIRFTHRVSMRFSWQTRLMTAQKIRFDQ
ncbi:MAG: methyltransferase domain-containing protein [Spirochaetaceae bacterium]|jgi:SAM-dependent methyltransferase|nr:methyltransferase domain-containing protein [Spirochaetaceae bacterium]